MPQFISKIKDDVQFVFQMPSFVGHPVQSNHFIVLVVSKMTENTDRIFLAIVISINLYQVWILELVRLPWI